MNILNSSHNKMHLIDENKTNKQRVYFEKTIFKDKNIDQNFIKIFKVSPTGNNICQGYIYFYLNLIERKSNFIGLFVKPEYRNEGIAQLLISYWIRFCLDNGIYNLDTIKQQRKPFILYLLKKFKFELLNIKAYETSPHTINICKCESIKEKCLFFKNPKQRETFKNSKININDNYFILDSITENTEVLDQVLLSTLYVSKDDETAYTKSLKLIDGFKR